LRQKISLLLGVLQVGAENRIPEAVSEISFKICRSNHWSLISTQLLKHNWMKWTT